MYTLVTHAGLGAPHLAKYYTATILDQTKHWWSPAPDKRWIQIEQHALSADLRVLLGTSPLLYKITRTFLGTAHATLKT